MLKTTLLSLLCAFSIASAGCTLTMKYNQCTEDSECQNTDGTQGFCSADQLCLPNTPLERLCTATAPNSPSPNAVHIGVLLDLRTNAATGRPNEAHRLIALNLGVRQINELVQLDGSRPIALDICNVGTSAVDADNATKILIEQRNVVAIIGPNTAAAATNMIGRIKAAGVPTISPAIMDSGIADAASQGLFYRLRACGKRAGSAARPRTGDAIWWQEYGAAWTSIRNRFLWRKHSPQVHPGVAAPRSDQQQDGSLLFVS
jgi:hypothetical protein